MLGLMDKSGLIVTLPASFLIFLLPLPAVLPGLLRLPPALRPWFMGLRPGFLTLRPWCLALHPWFLTLHPWCLALRPWCLLLTLSSPWLLPLILGCRASLLRSGLLRWLRALASRTALLERP